MNKSPINRHRGLSKGVGNIFQGICCLIFLCGFSACNSSDTDTASGFTAGGIASEDGAEAMAEALRGVVSSLTTAAVIPGVGINDGDALTLSKFKTQSLCQAEGSDFISCEGGGRASVQMKSCSQTQGSNFILEGTVTFVDCISSSDSCPLTLNGSLDFFMALGLPSTCIFPTIASCPLNSEIAFDGGPLQVSPCEGPPFEATLFDNHFLGTCPPSGECEGCFSLSEILLKDEGCFACVEQGTTCVIGEDDLECSRDGDCDRSPDNTDNCPEEYNPSQTDLDGNSVGEVCEPFAPVSQCGERLECDIDEDCLEDDRCSSEGCCQPLRALCPDMGPRPQCGEGLPPCRRAGEVCEDGCCIAALPCENDLECPLGEVCTEGLCSPSEPPPPPGPTPP